MRQDSLQRLQEKWDASEKGRWTHRLIPQVNEWVIVNTGKSTITWHRCSQITDALGPTFTGLNMRRHHSARRGAECPRMRNMYSSGASATLTRHTGIHTWAGDPREINVDNGAKVICGQRFRHSRYEATSRLREEETNNNGSP